MSDDSIVTERTKSVSSRVFPFGNIISRLEGDYKTISEVSEELGVSQGRIRYATRQEYVKAPSMEITRGKAKILLYTQEDMEELRIYFG